MTLSLQPGCFITSKSVSKLLIKRCVMKHILISGSFIHGGHCWKFWCLAHTDWGECTEHGVCSVMDVCQTYSNPPIHYHTVHIQHEQDKLFMCQLPGNVWVKILNSFDTLQNDTLKLWLIFEHLFVYRVKTFNEKVNLVNGTLKFLIYKQFIQPFLSRERSGTEQFNVFQFQ